MNCFLPAHNLKILVKSIYALARLPGEDLYVEATAEGLSLRTVNSSRSGYMCFMFKSEFFQIWSPATTSTRNDESRLQGDEDRTTGNFCKINMKSALIVYKAVSMLEKSIESCSISVDVDEWRLVFEIQCRSGVIRKYKLVLLNCTTMQASFDKSASNNIITIPGKLLVDGIQKIFHPSHDEVTLSVDLTEFNLRNYVDDAPQPDKVVKTELRLDHGEFEQFQVNANTEITFCLKELRALLTFIEAYQLPVVVRFDKPGKPVVISVESDPAFVSDLVLATFIEADGSQQQQQPQRSQQHVDGGSRQGSQLQSQPIVNVDSDSERPIPRKTQARAILSGPRRVTVSATAATVVLNQSQSNPASRHPNTSAVERESNESQRANEDRPTDGIDSDHVYESDPQEQAVVQSKTPPPTKRLRPNLFVGFSQSSIMASQVSDHSDTDENRVRLIHAPDSDLEDY